MRSPAEYKGEIIAPPGMTETAQRAGHIPGAKNIPWARAVNEDGTFFMRVPPYSNDTTSARLVSSAAVGSP